MVGTTPTICTASLPPSALAFGSSSTLVRRGARPLADPTLPADRPDDSRFVSERELAFIHEGKSEAHKRKIERVPYLVSRRIVCKRARRLLFKEIVRNPAVLAVWLNALIDLFVAFFFILV